jgi:hypothetical protein
MRVQRGLFRVWIVASVLWAIGVCWWLAEDGYETQQLMTSITCDIGAPDYGECFLRQRGPPGYDSWFTYNITTGGWWMFVVFPPFLALILGWIVLKVTLWIGRGFRQ